MDFDNLLPYIDADNTARRAFHGAHLAALETRYTSLETTVWRAIDLAAQHGDPNRYNGLLRNLADFRAKLNELWATVEATAPDWSRMYVQD
jgi:hypothetical protein